MYIWQTEIAKSVELLVSSQRVVGLLFVRTALNPIVIMPSGMRATWRKREKLNGRICDGFVERIPNDMLCRHGKQSTVNGRSSLRCMGRSVPSVALPTNES